MKDPHDPLYAVTRIDADGTRDVIVRWSQLTDAERDGLARLRKGARRRPEAIRIENP